MADRFKTRVTEILKVKYPLVVGTMLKWSDAELVAAAANAGVFASLASASFNTTQALREEIRKTRSLTDNPFGVNINLFPTMRPQNIDEYINTVLDEGIRVIETSGRSPEKYIDRIKKGNAILMHKCARVRDAKKVESLGADVIEIVGFECGGHPSAEQIGGLVLIPQVVDAVRIPVIAGGGIADERGFVAALVLGAEGVLIGTRFLATHECQLPISMKNKLIEAQSTEAVLALSTIGDPMRVLRTSLISKVLELEKKGTPPEELLPLVSGERTMKALLGGDIDGSLLACGQSVGLFDDVLYLKEVVENIINGAKAIEKRIASVIGRGE